jgi:hypothetical protein
MIPRDMALDLILEFKEGETTIIEAKKNALKCIKIMVDHNSITKSEHLKETYFNYWADVKQFIEKL